MLIFIFMLQSWIFPSSLFFVYPNWYIVEQAEETAMTAMCLNRKITEYIIWASIWEELPQGYTITINIVQVVTSSTPHKNEYFSICCISDWSIRITLSTAVAGNSRKWWPYFRTHQMDPVYSWRSSIRNGYVYNIGGRRTRFVTFMSIDCI